MANKTFDELNALSTPDTGDLVAIADVDASNEAKKTTVGELATTISTELSLGTAATTASTDYATAAQGATADTALQPSDNISELTNDENYVSSDALTTTSVSGNVNAGSIVDVIALNQDQYDNRTVGANDDKTLFVITDGTTSIADSDDVTITSATDNDFLVYETNAWVNKTQANTRTALGLGPYATAATITDSYVGHIEAPADGTYYLDPKVAEAREITGVYFAWTAGGSPDGDIDVQIGGTSVLSSTGRMNSGSSFTGTIKTDGTEDVAADAVITVVLGAVNGVADVTDLRFSVEYAQ